MPDAGWTRVPGMVLPRDEADVLGDDLHWLTREDCSQQNDSRHASCLRAWAAFPIYSDVHYRGLHQGQAMQRFCFVVLVTLGRFAVGAGHTA